MLAALAQSGVQVVFSSELVTTRMVVEAEPRASTLAGQVEEALSVRGLRLLEIAPGHYAVARRAELAAAPPERSVPERAAEFPLDEISIYGSRYTLDSRGIALPTAVTRELVEQSPGTRNDVLRAAQSLPGVATAASSQPYIRGSLPEDVQVSFDHVTIQDPFHLQGFQRLISVFDSSVIQQVDVYTGGFPVHYGARAGGVIEITPRNLPQGHLSGIDLGTQAVGASSVGHSESLPVDWLVSLRDNSVDLGHRAIRSGTRQLHLFDFIGRLHWQPTDSVGWTLGALTLNDHINLRYRWGGQSAAGDSHDTHGWLVREQSLGGYWRSVVVLDGAHEVFQQTGLEGFGSQTGSLLQLRRFDTLTLDARWYESAPGVSGWDLGATAFLTDGDNYFQSNLIARPPWRPLPATLVPVAISQDPTEVGASSYLARRFQWSAHLATEVGLRYDAQHDVGQGSQSQWSPRFNLQWQASKRLALHGSLGRFSQAQRPDEWRLESGQNQADPAQLVNEAVVGLDCMVDSGWRWRFESYRKRWLRVSPYYDNLFNPQGLTPALSPDRIRIAPDSASDDGLEASVIRDVGRHMRYWANASWSRVADDFGNLQVLRSWDQHWSANAGFNWVGPRLSLAAVLRTHQGWPRTPLVATEGPMPGGVTFAPGPRNSSRWGTYASVDMHAAWLIPQRGSSWELWAEVTNLMNRGNPCCMRVLPGPEGSAVPGNRITWQQRVLDVGASWRTRGW
jgi:hypothetical protein